MPRSQLSTEGPIQKDHREQEQSCDNTRIACLSQRLSKYDGQRVTPGQPPDTLFSRSWCKQADGHEDQAADTEHPPRLQHERDSQAIGDEFCTSQYGDVQYKG